MYRHRARDVGIPVTTVLPKNKGIVYLLYGGSFVYTQAMTTSRIDLNKALHYGWDAVRKDLWYFVGMALVVIIIGGIGNSTKGHPTNWNIIGALLSAWITCGYVTMLLSYQAGKKLPLDTLFTQTKQYGRVLGGTLLLGLIVCGGLLLLIVPGIYWALKYQYTIMLIIDKDLGIREAMRQSAALTAGQRMSLFVFDLALLGTVVLGAICLGVGILVALPIVWLANIVVYRQLSTPAPTVTV